MLSYMYFCELFFPDQISLGGLHETGRSRLSLLSPAGRNVGFITISAWTLEAESMDASSHTPCNATPHHQPVSYHFLSLRTSASGLSQHLSNSAEFSSTVTLYLHTHFLQELSKMVDVTRKSSCVHFQICNPCILLFPVSFSHWCYVLLIFPLSVKFKGHVKCVETHLASWGCLVK